MSIKTFKTLDRLYKSIEDLGNIFYTKDNNVTNEDVHESIEKVIDTYTELKNIDEDEDEDKLSDKEKKKLEEKLRDIEIEQKHAWGLHRISGGFVRADYDYVDGDKIYITLTDGIQSDCQNTNNVTHCSLWRDSLEWTD